MKSIEELRKQIDVLDDELTEIFLKRMARCGEIAELKKEGGIPVENSAREAEIAARLVGGAPAELKKYVERLYAEIFALSKEYQQNLASVKAENAPKQSKIARTVKTKS